MSTLDDRCEHGQVGGPEFCVLCLRARADRAELDLAHLLPVAAAAEHLLEHTPDDVLRGSPQLNGALIAWYQYQERARAAVKT